MHDDPMSVSECLQEIRRCAEECGETPIDCALRREHELSARRVEIASGAAGRAARKRSERLWGAVYVVVAAMLIVGGWQDWWDSLATAFGVLALALSCATMFRPSLSGGVGKILRGALGVIFAIFLTGFGFLPSVRGTEAGDFLGDFLNTLVSVWATIALVAVLHAFAVEVRWRRRMEKIRELDSQLAILRSALPLLR